jgi:hypothetical protein
VIFSRGMSQVSEMIPATVSKVDDISGQPFAARNSQDAHEGCLRH